MKNVFKFLQKKSVLPILALFLTFSFSAAYADNAKIVDVKKINPTTFDII